MKHLFFFLIIVSFPVQAYSFNVYVHSANAVMYESPSMHSKKIVTLNKGLKLDVTTKKGSWYKVNSKTDGSHTGWIYKFMVHEKPITNSSMLYSRLSSFFYKVESISKKSRRRPSSYSSTAAARGLREKRKHFAKKYKADYASLEKIEAIQISEEEAMFFLLEGVKNEKNN